jgi:hypothetical protein
MGSPTHAAAPDALSSDRRQFKQAARARETAGDIENYFIV